MTKDKLDQIQEELMQSFEKTTETWRRVPAVLKPAVSSIRDHKVLLDACAKSNLKGEKDLQNIRTELEEVHKVSSSSKNAVDQMNNKVQNMEKKLVKSTKELESLMSKVKEKEELLASFKTGDGSSKKQKKQLVQLKVIYDLCHVSTGIKWDIKAEPNEIRGCVSNSQTASFHPFCLNTDTCSSDFTSSYLWNQVMAQHTNNWSDLFESCSSEK